MREDRMGKFSAYFCLNCIFGVKLLIKSACLLIVDTDNEPVNCFIVTFCGSQFQLSWTHELSSQSFVGGRTCIQESLIHWNVHFGAWESVWFFWPRYTDEKRGNIPSWYSCWGALGRKELLGSGVCETWVMRCCSPGMVLPWCGGWGAVEREHVDGNPGNWEKEATRGE